MNNAIAFIGFQFDPTRTSPARYITTVGFETDSECPKIKVSVSKVSPKMAADSSPP
jgi:hypothetical protein